MGFLDGITGSGGDASKADEGASLTTVLETPALRVELALLVLLCADAMRNDLIATFDPDQTHDPSHTAAPATRSPPAGVHDLISFDTPQDEASAAAERARALRQQEIQSTQMQALRRSALTFFDKWRAGVLNRVCEVLCLRGEVVRQAKAKRRQNMAEAERAAQGNSLLIDFGSDPFAARPSPSSNSKKYGFYEAVENKLMAFEEEKRVLILHCLLLLLLSLENYTAHSRVLLVRLAGSLGIEVDVLAEHEKAVAQGLLATVASRMDAEEATKRQAANDSTSRKWKIGLAAVGGAVLIGVTGGLAAPLLAAGVGTVMGGLGLGAISGLLGTLAGSSVLVGSLFGAYGGKMTGRLMKQYAREVRDFEFIPIQGMPPSSLDLLLLTMCADPDRHSVKQSQEWSEEQEARDPRKREQHRLRVSVGVSGWLNSPSDVNKPWEVIDNTGTEPFSLRFELDAMLRLGNSLNDVLFSYAWDGVTYTVVSRTLLGALYAGLWPLGLVKVASVLDNPFSVAIARADKAGKVMARALIDKVQGERPVTLMGYSIGARVIYSCLVELAEQHAFGLVESVILMGAPVPSDSWSWRQIRCVVSARVVNVYSTEDYILGFLYRSTKLQMGVAGLQEVKDVSGIENMDMSKLVSGHDKYRYLVGTILTKAGFGDVDFNKVAEQERALEVSERKKEQVRRQVRKHKAESNQEDPSAQAATEMIIASDNKSSTLIEIPTTHTTDTAPSAVTRPPMQQRSGQQPSVRRAMTMPRAAGTPALDPLSGSIPTTESHSSPTPSRSRQSTFPVASRGCQTQTPTNMVPTPAAPPQQTKYANSVESDNEEDHRIQLVDIDSQKFSPSLEEMLRSSPSSGPHIQADETKAAGVHVHTVELAVDENDHEDSDDEVSSEFGDLNMVEPLPLDEENLALMA
jgi:hypothetical protein